MIENVLTLSIKDNLEDAEELFKKNKIRHVPITAGKKILGLLSYTDLMHVSSTDTVGEDKHDVDTAIYNMFSIEQVMAKDVVSVTSKTTIEEVAEFLSKKEFHALPVVENNELVGIVTTTDLITYLLE